MNQKRAASSFYARIFSRMYDPVMRSFEEKILLQRRQSLLENLRGDILEVGAGTGVNFALYSAEARVIACEPSLPMLAKAYEKLETYPPIASIDLVHAGIGDEELNEHIPPGGLDAVVFTLVLCTIPHPELAVNQVKQWLKPEGRLIVLEHIASDKPVARRLQHAIEPLWTPLAEGCRLTRDTDQMLRQSGFEPEQEEYFSAGMRFYQAVLRCG